MDKDTRKVLRAAEDQGFVLDPGRRGRHTQVRGDDGRVISVVPGTGSDYRGLRNLIADLRRAGMVWPAPTRKSKRLGLDGPAQQGTMNT